MKTQKVGLIIYCSDISLTVLMKHSNAMVIVLYLLGAMAGAKKVLMAQAANSMSSQSDPTISVELAHSKLMADTTIQHSHSDGFLKEPKVPEWLEWIGELLRAASPVISFFFWVGLALLVAMLLYFLVTEVMGVKVFQSKSKPMQSVSASDWRPEAKDARDLLAAADALAAQGNYNDAVHLILLRSIEHIDRFRPMAVRPALTARDIGSMAALPDLARPTFTRIASAVERTLFAGKNIDQREFGACRDAYADFALPAGWQA
jgi:hypothetical protein